MAASRHIWCGRTSSRERDLGGSIDLRKVCDNIECLTVFFLSHDCMCDKLHWSLLLAELQRHAASMTMLVSRYDET